MNNEPVAWITMSGLSYQQTGLNDRPLYTHPAKTLTDEEIPVLTILHNAQSVPLGHAIYETDKEYEKLKKIVIASVKWAILRKAQEK